MSPFFFPRSVSKYRCKRLQRPIGHLCVRSGQLRGHPYSHACSKVLAESTFTCLKRWVSFTWRKPLHSLMVGLSVLAPEAILPTGRTNTQTQDGGEGKGDWEKEMTREVGSKQPTSCNAILFKSNTVKNPQSRLPLPPYPQLRAPLSGCDLKRNNTKVTQLHPSAFRKQ